MNPNAVSITVVLSARNQEQCLESSVQQLRTIIPQFFLMWEFLIFDDASRDRTGPIAERLALYDENIRVFHNEQPRGSSGCHPEALEQAAFEHFLLIPVSPDFDGESLRPLLEAAGTADIVAPYPLAGMGQPLPERLFAEALNRLTGLKLRSYAGPVLHRTELIKAHVPVASRLGYQAEMLVKLLKLGHSIREVGIAHRPQSSGLARAIHRLSTLGSRA